eukprot:1142866-Pelagomonas_calceolata.AAC.3
MYVEHPEIKIQDAAKGCLLQLGVLDDEAAKHANKVFDSSGSGQSYDVFLSHKRTDAKDFARDATVPKTSPCLRRKGRGDVIKKACLHVSLITCLVSRAGRKVSAKTLVCMCVFSLNPTSGNHWGGGGQGSEPHVKPDG